MSDKNATTHGLDDLSIALPKTATKPITVPKKRGRKGNKIATAFKEIPTEAVNFNDYCKQHGIEPTVMRQVKRHDKFPEMGQVFVLQDKTTRVMKIWRDPNIPSKYLKAK